VRFSLRSIAHSEIGLVRSTNQDSAYVSGTVLAVADGMGGAAAGDLASTVAINHIAAMDATHPAAEKLVEELQLAVAAANDQIHDLVVWDPVLEGMGTTVEAAVFDGEQLTFEHLGDSRAYLLRDGKFNRLTRDHSWVQQMVDSGQMSVEEAEAHPKRSFVTRVANGHEEFRPELFTLEVKLGDRVLLCSDGLSGPVEEQELQRLLAIPDLEKASAKLSRAARAAGAPDNLTLIIADVVEWNAELDAVPGELFGAVKTVKVPQVPHISIADDTSAASHSRRTSAVAPPLRHPVGAGDAAAETGEYAALVPVSSRSAATQRSGRGLLIAVIAVLLAIIVGGLFAVRHYLQQHFYLGPAAEVVAVYRGVPDELLGFSLSELSETSEVLLSDLPTYYADQVRTKRLRSDTLSGAQQTLAELRELAQYCIAQRAQATNPPPSTESPSTETPGATPNTTGTPPVSPPASATPPSASASNSTQPGTTAPASPNNTTNPTNPTNTANTVNPTNTTTLPVTPSPEAPDFWECP
jgi:protein phosphatase